MGRTYALDNAQGACPKVLCRSIAGSEERGENGEALLQTTPILPGDARARIDEDEPGITGLSRSTGQERPRGFSYRAVPGSSGRAWGRSAAGPRVSTTGAGVGPGGRTEGLVLEAGGGVMVARKR